MARHYDSKTFKTSTSLGYLLKVAHTRLHDCAAQSFATHDISLIQWIVLMKLHEGTARTAGDLCKRMHYDTGAVTRMIDQLEERGYVKRERSLEDRRVVELQLTRSGRSKITQLTPLMVDKLNGALADFSAAEFGELTRLLHKLIHNLDQAGQTGSSA